MLKCASIYTSEVDDPGVALSEIKAQLEQKITLLRHSVGIVMCHPEFIASGVLKHICENLPFDLAGVTTSSQAVNDGIGELLLTIFVMTSDDIVFKAGMTEELGTDVDGPVQAAYESTLARMSGAVEPCEPPGLVLIFPPFGRHSGDDYVRAWEKIFPGTPVFGTHAVDDTITFAESETIYNGQHHKAAMSFVLCYGNIHPRFMVATFSEKHAIASKVEITGAKGNCVFEINHVNAREYFEKIGIADSISYLTPFMIDLLKRGDHDGVPVLRGFLSFIEGGAIIFCGDMDEESTFILLKCDVDDMLSSTQQKIAQINAMSDVNGVLLFPCVIRRAILIGTNKPLLELENAKEAISQNIPFMMGYAGGEICPTSIREGVPVNRFHNYSLVILIV